MANGTGLNKLYKLECVWHAGMGSLMESDMCLTAGQFCLYI